MPCSMGSAEMRGASGFGPSMVGCGSDSDDAWSPAAFSGSDASEACSATAGASGSAVGDAGFSAAVNAPRSTSSATLTLRNFITSSVILNCRSNSAMSAGKPTKSRSKYLPLSRFLTG